MGGPPPPSRPHLDDRPRQLDPRVVQVWRVFSSLGLLPLVAVASLLGLMLLGRPGLVIAGAGLVAMVVSVAWYQPARYRRWRWRLTDLALELTYGVLVHRHQSVPFFRVQQIDIVEGPVDRLLGLANLQVTTAAASGSAVLPGISATDAPAVRAELLARAAEAVAEHHGEVRDAV